MSFLDRIQILMASVILFIASGVGVFRWVGQFDRSPILLALESWFPVLENFDYLLISLGYALLFLAALMLVMIAFREENFESTITMDTDNGKMKISTQALTEYIRSLRDNVQGITSIRPEVTSPAGGMELVVNVVVRESDPVPDVVDRFEEKLKNKLKDVFKLKNLDRISVCVDDIEASSTSESDE
ncbi:MAG: alkaline shock response membrane anchor protein AmaP [bacterium]